VLLVKARAQVVTASHLADDLDESIGERESVPGKLGRAVPADRVHEHMIGREVAQLLAHQLDELFGRRRLGPRQHRVEDRAMTEAIAVRERLAQMCAGGLALARQVRRREPAPRDSAEDVAEQLRLAGDQRSDLRLAARVLVDVTLVEVLVNPATIAESVGRVTARAAGLRGRTELHLRENGLDFVLGPAHAPNSLHGTTVGTSTSLGCPAGGPGVLRLQPTCGLIS
jgi:hypothetical protein